MEIKAVIFDLDGTLLDTVDDLLESVNYALAYYNYPKRTKEEVRLAVGDGISKLMERMCPIGIDITPCLEKFKEFYINIKQSKTHPYDGIKELLEELKKRNIKVGILSNKFDRGTKLHSNMFFNGLIDYAQGEDSINGILPKPHTEGFFKVLDELNVKKENVIYAGDSEVDIKTAKNAKVPCISVLWGLKTKEFLIKNGGSLFASKPLEILDMI